MSHSAQRRSDAQLNRSRIIAAATEVFASVDGRRRSGTSLSALALPSARFTGTFPARMRCWIRSSRRRWRRCWATWRLLIGSQMLWWRS